MKRNLNYKKVFYFILIIANVFLISFVMLLIYDHLNIDGRKNRSYVSSYQENSNVTYQVNAIENSYVTEENFGKSNSYILKYTDNIMFNFSYNYTSSSDMITKADYKIIANLSGNYKKSSNDVKEIYNKDFVLDSGSLTSNQKTIYFEDSIAVNIHEYNDILKKLQEDIKLPLLGNLNVYLEVLTKDKNDSVIDQYRHNANVSLLSEIYDVDVDELEPRVKDFYLDDLEINYFYLIILASLIVGFSAVIMVLVRKILQKKLTKGEREVNRYLKVYDDFIVNVDDGIDEDKYEVVMIKEFKELLTLANNNMTSILSFNQKKKGMFYVILDHYLYKFEVNYRS